MKFSGKFSVSCWSYTWCLRGVPHSSIEGKFQTFPDWLIHRYDLGWWQELLQEYLLFVHNAISHAQLNVLGRNFAMSTSAADLIGTCACAHEVQFKWILAADLGFCGNVSTPIVFEMHRSRHGHFSGRSKQIHFFFSLDVHLKSRWGYSPSSSYLTASGWYRWQ